MSKPAVSIGRTFGASTGILRQALPGLVTATLVFSLPAQILVEYLVYHRMDPDAFGKQLRLYSAVSLILTPFLAAAAILAARAVLDGHSLHPWELVRASAASWGRIIKVQIPASILMLLGFLALVVPGVVLMGRWALIESVALFENPSPKACRSRSSGLVLGSTGPVLLALLVLYLPSFLVAAVSGFLMGTYPSLDNFVFSALSSSASDLLGMLAYIGMFLIYRERVSAQDDDAFDTRPPPIG